MRPTPFSRDILDLGPRTVNPRITHTARLIRLQIPRFHTAQEVVAARGEAEFRSG